MKFNHPEFCSKHCKKRGLGACYINVSDLLLYLRGILMILSFLGVICSIYVDHGNDLQCTDHVKNVPFYYITLSILFTVHYSLILYNTAICMPFRTLTLAFFYYFSTFLTQIMIIALLALGCFSCSVFESAHPRPLVICTVISPICFMCNMGTAYLFVITAKWNKIKQSKGKDETEGSRPQVHHITQLLLQNGGSSKGRNHE